MDCRHTIVRPRRIGCQNRIHFAGFTRRTLTQNSKGMLRYAVTGSSVAATLYQVKDSLRMHTNSSRVFLNGTSRLQFLEGSVDSLAIQGVEDKSMIEEFDRTRCQSQ